MKPIVVKLGGSLSGSAQLDAWLRAIAGQGGGRAAIVPGGGVFADRVRQLQQQTHIDDRSAHRLALFAMTQYGHLLMSLQPGLQPVFNTDEIRNALVAGRVPIWLPLAIVNDDAGLPANWDCTSDSIALWLAQEINADLCLVKSITPAGSVCTAEAQQQAGVIDRAFVHLLRQGTTEAYWLGPAQYGCFPDLHHGARIIPASHSGRQGVPA